MRETPQKEHNLTIQIIAKELKLLINKITPKTTNMSFHHNEPQCIKHQYKLIETKIKLS